MKSQRVFFFRSNFIFHLEIHKYTDGMSQGIGYANILTFKYMYMYIQPPKHLA